MATSPIPIPQQAGDPGLTQTDPRAVLAALSQGHTVGSGTTSVGTQIPMPQPLTNPIQRAQQSGVAQGSFATKGAHQRASLQNLSGSVRNLVQTAVDVHQQQQNKQLGQKFSTLTGSVKGIQAADEMQKNAQAMLQADPSSQQGQQMLQQAQQMKQHNTTILNQLLDPTTPEGKKNIKLFNKGFGFDDKNADTPERAAAIQSMRQQSQTQVQTPATNAPGPMGSSQQVLPPSSTPMANSGMNEGAARLLSQMPQSLQVSPQTQLQGEMVKSGVTPRAATGTAVLNNQERAAATTMTIDQKNEKMLTDAGLKSDQIVASLPAKGLQVVRKPDGSIDRNPDGTMKTRNLSMEEMAGNPELAQKYQENKTKMELQVAQAKATSVRAAVAEMREGRLRSQAAQAQQPGAIQNWAKLVSDPTSGVTLAQVPAAARGPVVNAVVMGGMKIAKPLSSQELNRMDLANNAVKNIEEAQSILSRRPDMFGPAGWGSTKFEQAIAGGDPDALRYQAAIQLANLPAVGIHGVRGKWALEDLNKLDGNLYLNPQSMAGVLSEIHRSAGEFQNLAGRGDSTSGGTPDGGYKTLQGPNGPVKAKVVNGKWVDEKGNPL